MMYIFYDLHIIVFHVIVSVFEECLPRVCPVLCSRTVFV